MLEIVSNEEVGAEEIVVTPETEVAEIVEVISAEEAAPEEVVVPAEEEVLPPPEVFEEPAAE